MINGLKREELIASNSMILHELYFDSLGGGSQPDGDLRGALAARLWHVEKWQIQFGAMGKALGGGSGWVLLTYSHRDKKLDQPVGCGSYVLFGRSQSDSRAGYV